MLDNAVNTIKEILDKTGIEVPVEEIASELDSLAGSDSDHIDAAANALVGQYVMRAQRKPAAIQKREAPPDPGLIAAQSAIAMCLDRGACCAGAGEASVEYQGRSGKRRSGEYVFLIKPDRSVVVHGTAGILPACYLGKAETIRVDISENRLSIVASGRGESLTITLDKLYVFQELFLPQSLGHEKTPPSETEAMSEEEQALHARLKKLRRDLAAESGVHFLPAVFDNRTLGELVRQKPRTQSDIRLIRGFGEVRRAKYGAAVLAAINESEPAR